MVLFSDNIRHNYHAMNVISWGSGWAAKRLWNYFNTAVCLSVCVSVRDDIKVAFKVAQNLSIHNILQYNFIGM